jgi:FkbM family methyltransferase
MIEDLVYDVGLGDGADTAYYLAKGRRVLAIDANPTAVSRVSTQFADAIKAKRLEVLNIGISGSEGVKSFWICDGRPEWSSFHPSIASRDEMPHHEVTVECRSFASVLGQFGVPRYLKLDIEGSEIHCLRELRGPDLPTYISFEKSGYEVQALRILEGLGYTGFKMVSQFHFLPVEFPPTPEQRRYEAALRFAQSRNILARAACKLGMRTLLHREIARHRTRSGWSFPQGSSGPLSDETRGKWQSYGQILDTFARAEEARHRGEPSIFWASESRSFWADFHARRAA